MYLKTTTNETDLACQKAVENALFPGGILAPDLRGRVTRPKTAREREIQALEREIVDGINKSSRRKK